MARFLYLLLVLLVAAVAIGAGVLGFRDFPPPTKTVEKTISNEQFNR